MNLIDPRNNTIILDLKEMHQAFSESSNYVYFKVVLNKIDATAKVQNTK